MVDVGGEVEGFAAVAVGDYEFVLGEGEVAGVDGFVDVWGGEFAVVPRTSQLGMQREIVNPA